MAGPNITQAQRLNWHLFPRFYEIPRKVDSQRYSSALDKAQERARKFMAHYSTPPRVNVSFFGNNNRSYYQWHRSLKEKEIQAGSILVHFDTHSDMDRGEIFLPPESDSLHYDLNQYTDEELSIANFIIPALYEGTISEVYWVLPDWAAKGTEKGRGLQFASGFETGRNEYYVGRNKSDGSIYFSVNKPKRKYVSNIRKIVIHNIYKEDLPDFSRKSESIIVDIDLDWVQNTGYDTMSHYDKDSQFVGVYSEYSLDKSFGSIKGLVATLKDKGIKPGSVTISLSPEYTFTDNVDDLADALVREISDSGWIQNPEFIFGDASYSLNGYFLGNALYQLVMDNKQLDPRINPESDVSVADFNGQRVAGVLQTIDEKEYPHRRHSHSRGYANGIFNRTLPSSHRQGYLTYKTSRNDYSFFIELSKRYGFEKLRESLEELQTIQALLSGEVDEAYKKVLTLIKPMLLPDYGLQCYVPKS